VPWSSYIKLVDAQGTRESRRLVERMTERRVAAQAHIDMDVFFRQDTRDMPLGQIFRNHREALAAVAHSRGLSGDWRTDTFTPEEELQYKTQFTVVGPSQVPPPGSPHRLF
jgi:hypothetical protein